MPPALFAAKAAIKMHEDRHTISTFQVKMAIQLVVIVNVLLTRTKAASEAAVNI